MKGIKCDFKKATSEDFFSLISDSAFSRRSTNQNSQPELQQEQQAGMMIRAWAQEHSWHLL